MGLFVFTTGEYSDFGIHSIYTRDIALLPKEQEKMLASMCSRSREYEKERAAALALAGIASADWWDARGRAQYMAALKLFASAEGWGGQHPEPDWLEEEIRAHGFTPVDFQEVWFGSPR